MTLDRRSSDHLPLNGVRVVDMAAALAGPWAAGILAEQGADVVKVERPDGGDVLRRTAPSHGGVSAMFHMANRGKRSIVLDLGQSDGVEAALALVAEADIVIQNFRPGVAERLGLGYGDLRRVNSEVILVAVTGFGPDGPYSRRPAYDSVIQAWCGLADAQRAPDDGEPLLGTQTIADKITSLVAAQAATAALWARDRGRGGQRVDVSMFDTAAAFTWVDGAGHALLAESSIESRRAATSGRRCVRLADGWLTLTLASPAAIWAAADVFGVGSTLTERLVEGGTDPAPRAEFDTELRRRARSFVAAAVAERLDAAGVPFGLVRPADDLVDDPHAREVELFVQTAHPSAGRLVETRPPVRFAGLPSPVPGPSPRLGEHGASPWSPSGPAV